MHVYRLPPRPPTPPPHPTPPRCPSRAGIASILLFVFVACYLAANFREPLPKPMPCDPTAWCISGTNEVGV